MNAHPHGDCHNHFVIVHNGIIENYMTLKKELIEKGHVFKSETDTEVVAHLAEELDDGNFFLLSEKYWLKLRALTVWYSWMIPIRIPLSARRRIIL